MPVCIEDECNPDLPPASLLFRSARQYAYGVLFSLAETQRRLERMAMRKRTPLEGEYGPVCVMGETYQYSDSHAIYSTAQRFWVYAEELKSFSEMMNCRL